MDHGFLILKYLCLGSFFYIDILNFSNPYWPLFLKTPEFGTFNALLILLHCRVEDEHIFGWVTRRPVSFPRLGAGFSVGQNQA